MVEANWSGTYPTLCFGRWTLKVNGKDVTSLIPEELRETSMNTYGRYQSWHFDDNYMEVFDSYTNGLDDDDWIEENDYWLSKITDDLDLKYEIYEAIKNEDFRSGSCGGCI